MYVVTSIPLVSRTRATLRSAEFGFFGVVVYTRVHTPRRCGLPLSAGVLVLSTLSSRPLRTSCWIVGTAAASWSYVVGWCWLVRGGAGGTPSTSGAVVRFRPTPVVGRVARPRSPLRRKNRRS